MFDEEVERARGDILAEPTYRPAAMLQTLEREYLLIAPDDYDAELSLAILHVIAGAYRDEELDRFDSLMNDFAQSHRATVRGLLDAHVDDQRADPLLFQPADQDLSRGRAAVEVQRRQQDQKHAPDDAGDQQDAPTTRTPGPRGNRIGGGRCGHRLVISGHVDDRNGRQARESSRSALDTCPWKHS